MGGSGEVVMGSPAPAVAAPFREHERYLWGLCYRMTEDAAEADDLVQDTFVRAMEQPPPRTNRGARGSSASR